MRDIQTELDDLCSTLASYPDCGRVTSAIPELARVDPKKFAIAVADLNGQTWSAGNAEEPFSIQSISKVFLLALSLGRLGDQLWERVGREPSGSAFNSIVQLEHEGGVPRNPFINAGALVVTDIVLGRREPREAIGEILQFVRAVSEDDSIFVDDNVANSEARFSHRNASLAHFLAAHGNLTNSVERVIGTYVHQCAIAMSCRQLARSGLFLAHGGVNPASGSQILSAKRARRINALMMTCGHYDGSGDFAFRVGLPGKSGIGGGILAIVPGKASLCVWSPGLNQQGNSQLGTLALERLAHAAGWNVFGS
ncbi:glutaminase [alpha proteobacterium U9-1i]|nr:glutaminase [alpha proteobacterium U9-1i]